MEVKTYKLRTDMMCAFVKVMFYDGTNVEEIKDFCGDRVLDVKGEDILILNESDDFFNAYAGPQDIINGVEVQRYTDEVQTLKPGMCAVQVAADGDIIATTKEQLDREAYPFISRVRMMKAFKVVYNAAVSGGLHLSEKAMDWLREHEVDFKVESGNNYGPFADIPRHDSRLVECIETLGKEANGPANGWTPEAELHVVEITGNYYYIDNHDGGGEEVIDVNKMKDATV